MVWEKYFRCAENLLEVLNWNSAGDGSCWKSLWTGLLIYWNKLTSLLVKGNKLRVVFFWNLMNTFVVSDCTLDITSHDSTLFPFISDCITLSRPDGRPIEPAIFLDVRILSLQDENIKTTVNVPFTRQKLRNLSLCLTVLCGHNSFYVTSFSPCYAQIEPLK